MVVIHENVSSMLTSGRKNTPKWQSKIHQNISILWFELQFVYLCPVVHVVMFHTTYSVVTVYIFTLSSNNKHQNNFRSAHKI